jgi:hypothetical protein
MTIAEPIIGVYTDADRPQPDTGTPASWEVTIANTSGVDLTLSVYVVCASGAGGASAASQVQGARIVRQVHTKIKNAKG